MPAAHVSGPVLAFHPSPNTFTWEVMEERRMRKLKLNYSRHYNVKREHRPAREATFVGVAAAPMESYSVGGHSANSPDVLETALEIGKKNSNSIAPFSTLSAKSTCGKYFSFTTINNKMKIGIPPTNPTKWRTTHLPT